MFNSIMTSNEKSDVRLGDFLKSGDFSISCQLGDISGIYAIGMRRMLGRAARSVSRRADVWRRVGQSASFLHAPHKAGRRAGDVDALALGRDLNARALACAWNRKLRDHAI